MSATTEQCTPVVHVIDDDDDVRSSVEWTLRSMGHQVQAHHHPRVFLERFDPQPPSCLVVDLILPGIMGLSLCRELISQEANCAFVIITGYGDVASAVEAMRLGVVDFLEKPCSRQKLLEAVQRGLDQVERRSLERAEEQSVAQRLGALTSRERQVFQCMAQGLVTKEIASQLSISPKTVDVHRSKIAQKLRIDSPTQLAHIIALDKLRQVRLGRG